MSKRLQVLMDEREFREIRKLAKQERMTVAEWVRHALRSAYRQRPAADPEKKLAVVKAAISGSYPTGDIHQMLAEIERGYGAGSGE